MITFGKKKRLGDAIFTSNTSSSVPAGMIIQVKGNRRGQIEDVNPRSMDGVDLFSKYYHRDARIYVDKYFTEVVSLIRRKEAKDANNA